MHKNKFKFELVHGQTVLPDGLTSVFLGKYYKCKSIITVRGSDVNTVTTHSMEYKMVRYALKNADRITCVSRNLKNRMVNRFFIPEGKITVIPNGVDLNFSKGIKINSKRKMYNIPSNAMLFLSVGSLLPVKDPLMLLSAFKRVQREIKNTHLIFVGDGLLRGKIINYIENQDLEDFVHLVGYIPHCEVGEFIFECDIFCLASVREGWPNVIFEAMSFGKPIVATNVGGIPEAIISEDYGFLVPPKQPNNLAEAMIKAVTKQWNQKKIKNYALKQSWEKVAQKYYNEYETTLYNTVHSK